MYWFEYTPDIEKRLRDREIAEAFAEGEARGETRGKFEMVKNLLSVGTPIEFIKKATGWSEDQIFKAAVDK